MRRAFAAITTTVAVLGTAAAAQATTRYVAKGGSNTANDCSVQASPCLTITRAVGQAGSGDTISIGPGTFDEAITVPANRTLTITGAGAGVGSAFDPPTQTFVDASSTQSAAFELDSPSNSISNLRARGGVHQFSPTDTFAESAITSFIPASIQLTVRNTVLDQTPGVDVTNNQPVVETINAPATVLIIGSAITAQQIGVYNRTSSSTETINGSTITAPLSPGGTNTAVQAFEGQINLTDSTLTGDIAVDADGSGVAATRTVMRAKNIGLDVEDRDGSSASLSDSIVAPASGELDTGVLVDSTNASSGTPPRVSLTGDSILARSDHHAVALDTRPARSNTQIVSRNTILRAIDPGNGADQADIQTSTTNPLTWDIGHTAYTTVSGPGIPPPGSATNFNTVPHFFDESSGDVHLDTDSTLFDKGDPTVLLTGETDVTGRPRAVAFICGGPALPDVGAYETPPPPCPLQPPDTTTTTTQATPPPPPPAQPPPPAKDTTKPVITHLSLASSRFATTASTRHRKPTVHHGTTLRFTLSETATVAVVVELAHHRKHHKTTYTRIGAITYRGQKKGANTHRFTGHVGAHKLKAGSYRATVSAIDPAGNHSSPHHLTFSIVHA